MKKVITMFVVVGLSLSAASSAVFATSKPNAPAQVMEETVKPQLFTGTVVETEKGLALETKDGMILLRGLDIKAMTNKEVVINGIAKNEEGDKVIYVVRATAKS